MPQHTASQLPPDMRTHRPHRHCPPKAHTNTTLPKPTLTPPSQSPHQHRPPKAHRHCPCKVHTNTALPRPTPTLPMTLGHCPPMTLPAQPHRHNDTAQPPLKKDSPCARELNTHGPQSTPTFTTILVPNGGELAQARARDVTSRTFLGSHLGLGEKSG